MLFSLINFIKYAPSQNIENQIILKYLGAFNIKGLNRIFRNLQKMSLPCNGAWHSSHTLPTMVHGSCFRNPYGKIKPILLISIRPPYWIKLDGWRSKRDRVDLLLNLDLISEFCFHQTPLRVVQANFVYHAQYIGSSWSISYFYTIFLSFPKKTLKYG